MSRPSLASGSARNARRALVALLASSFLCVLGLECAARLLVWRSEQASFDDAMQEPTRDARSGPLRLRDIIRPSAHADIVYELVPGLHTTFQQQPLRTDSHGFRGPALPPGKPEGVRRIVGLGDSVMFGWGVREEESYLRLVEAAAGRAGSRWQAINTAAPGYNTVMEVATLREKGLAFEPDLVILGLIPNDIGLPNFLYLPLDPLDLRRSFLWSELRRAAKRLAGPGTKRRSALRGAPRAAHDRHFEDDPARIEARHRHLAGRQNLRSALEQLQALRVQHGFEVLLLTFDLILYAPTEGRSPAAALALGFAREHGWQVVEPEARFQRELERRGFESYAGTALALSDRDPHPSALGHRLLADELLATLMPASAKQAPEQAPESGTHEPVPGATSSMKARMRAK